MTYVKGDNRKHGFARTPTYRAWGQIKVRCQNPRNRAYPDYGGRGITVCDRWQSFESFLADMGPRPSSAHSIDRIDNNGHYELSNCRWATKPEQNRNQRRNIRFITADGEVMCAMEVARAIAMPKSTFFRICHSWLEAA